MVSRVTWHKIAPVIGLTLVAGVAGLFFLLPRKNISSPIYSATSDKIDLAVVDGITKLEKNIFIPSGLYRAAIVPHHLIVPEAIALGVKVVAAVPPRIIFVISPDHFGKCPKLLCTSYGSYKTFFGDVAISKDFVKQLLSYEEIVAESDLFTDEHGVYSVVPFIKHYLPNTSVVPIAVSQRGVGDEQSRTRFFEMIDKLAKRNSVAFLVSSDFSHYLPLKEANTNDKQTQNIFCAGNSKAILDLKNPSQSDCPLCLWILAQTAKNNGFWNPTAIWHSNSSEILNDINVKETTSHFVFVLSSNSTEKQCERLITEKQKKILFVGDMLFDRYIRQIITKRGENYPFSCVDHLLQSVDIVVGNLEGPITEHQSISIGSKIGSAENYVFTFPTTTPLLLARHNIGLVNLGNNHINNFGKAGIESTKKYLAAAGVHYIGGVEGDEPLHRIGDISFVSFNQFGGQSPEKVASVITTERAQNQTVIVYTHWGQEYSQSVDGIENIAELFVKSGASAIIGSHPHIVIPRRNIGNVPVYYSLGNFIFDQYFDSTVTKGLAVLLSVTDGIIKTWEYPLSLEPDGRTCVVN
jgi:AmmeMemoRadiSam system protein B